MDLEVQDNPVFKVYSCFITSKVWLDLTASVEVCFWLRIETRHWGSVQLLTEDWRGHHRYQRLLTPWPLHSLDNQDTSLMLEAVKIRKNWVEKATIQLSFKHINLWMLACLREGFKTTKKNPSSMCHEKHFLLKKILILLLLLTFSLPLLTSFHQ